MPRKLKRRLFWGLVASVFVTIAVFTFSPHSSKYPDTGYDAQTLLELEKVGGSWHESLGDHSIENIRRVGTNALPGLIGWVARPLPKILGISPYALDIVIPRFVQQSDFAREHPLRLNETATAEVERHYKMALAVFRVLGQDARTAVPKLTELVNASDIEVKGCAMDCLGEIGPAASEAVPDILRHARVGNDDYVRAVALYSLGKIHSRPEVVIPKMIKLIEERKTHRSYVLRVFAGYGPDARNVTPTIVTLLTNADDYTRIDATNALRKVSPDLALKMFGDEVK